MAKIVLYDLARIVKVTVTVFKKLFVICAGFSRHCFQNFFVQRSKRNLIFLREAIRRSKFYTCKGAKEGQ